MDKGKPLHLYGFLIGCAITGMVILGSAMGIFEPSELKMLDWRFSVRGAGDPSTCPGLSQVALVAIDDASFRELDRRWPWPRAWYGQLAGKLKELGARTIVFDLTFTESTEKERADPEAEQSFKQGMDGIFSAHLRSAREKEARAAKEQLLELYAKPPGILQDQVFSADLKRAGNVILDALISPEKKWYMPVPVLLESSAGVGIANAAYDADGFVRSVQPVFLGNDGREYLSLGVAAYLASEGLALSSVSPEHGRLKLNCRSPWGTSREIAIPVTGEGTMLINFAGPKGTIPTYPFYQVLKGEVKGEAFRDKVVFVGVTAPILHDEFPAPYGEGVPMPGAEIHANAFRTLVDRDFLAGVQPWVQSLVLLLIGMATSVVVMRVRPLWGFLYIIAAMGIIIFTGVYLFIADNLWWEMSSTLWLIFLCAAGVVVFRVLVEEAEKRRIRSTLGRYMSKPVLDEILKNHEEVRMGGRSQEVTVLFSDIRSFATLSERMSAEETVSLLNEYLEGMVSVVFRNKGTLDKFVGDSVMATFGVPTPRPDDAYRACKTALEMMDKLRQLQDKWRSEGKAGFDMGIGLNTGEVVVGNMGHPRRMEYTVIGDNVNLASRMESTNKEYATHILITGRTLEKVRDQVVVKFITETKVRGKEEPVQVYELVGLKDD